MNLPRKNKGLLETVVGDECVIYDTRHNESHCLRPLAADVYALCDGVTTEEQALATLQEKGHQVDADLLAAVVMELESKELLKVEVKEDVKSSVLSSISRRELLGTAGKAAAAVMILSVSTPTPASAASICVGSCALGEPGNSCDTGCVGRCYGCYAYSAYINGRPSNGRLPEGDRCFWVFTSSTCNTSLNGADPRYQEDCRTAYLNAGVDQAWCCLSDSDPYTEDGSIDNGGDYMIVQYTGASTARCVYPA